MSSDRPLNVDPAELRKHAAAFEEIAQLAHESVGRLQASLIQEGTPWGSDGPGKAFAKTYVPDANQGIENMKTVANSLHNFGTQLMAAANSYVQADQASAAQVNTTGKSLTPSPGTAASVNSNALAIGPQTVSSAPPESDASITSSTSSTPSAVGASGSNDQVSSVDNAVPNLPQQPAQQLPEQSGRPTNPTNPSGLPQPSVPGTDGSPEPSSQANGPAAVPPDLNEEAMRTAPAPRTAVPRASEAAASAEEVAESKPPTPWTENHSRGAVARTEVRPPNTPWSRQLTSSIPQQRNDKKENRGPKRATSTVVGPNPVIVRLGEGLAQRQHIPVTGFDTASLDETTVIEFVSAVDDVVGPYPIRLRSVHIASLGGQIAASAAITRSDGITSVALTLGLEVAVDPQSFIEMSYAMALSGYGVAGSERRPVYAATVRELGRVLNVAGNNAAQPLAQRRLIAAYLSVDHPGRRNDRLAAVVNGYRRWRNQLSGRSFHGAALDPAEALPDAFTDVVVNGVDAVEPASVLHRLLVGTVPFGGVSS